MKGLGEGAPEGGGGERGGGMGRGEGNEIAGFKIGHLWLERQKRCVDGEGKRKQGKQGRR